MASCLSMPGMHLRETRNHFILHCVLSVSDEHPSRPAASMLPANHLLENARDFGAAGLDWNQVTASHVKCSGSEYVDVLRNWAVHFERKVAKRSMSFQPFKSDFSAAQKEAKALLRSLQRRDPVAAERYRAFDAIDVAPWRLADAQYLVSRRYGFKSWAALKSCLTTPK